MLEIENIPLVSIVMPAYNSSKTIESSIKSVIAQSYTNWELLIINDGSEDSTIIEVKKFLSDNRISLITQSNKGVASARNNGIKNSKGDYIAFIDSDDLWLKEKLKLQVDCFDFHPDYTLIHTANMIFYDRMEDAVLNHYVEPFKIKDDYHRLLVSDFIVTSTVIIKKEILKDEIYFDENLLGTEDWDLWIKISKKNKIGFIQIPLVYYREHAAGISKNHERQLYNDFLVREKNVYQNIDVPRDIKTMSKWMFQKKRIFIEFNQHSVLSILKQYFLMIIKFPLYSETYKFPFKFFLKKMFSKH